MPSISDKKCRKMNIDSLKKGDKLAFAQFVRTYQDMVFACCRAVGLNKDDCEDAAAETFLSAWQAIPRFNGEGKLSSWLWTIAYRKASTIRGQKRPADLLADNVLMQQAESTGQSSVLALENREQTDLIWEAVGRLPHPWAAAIVLFYREDKSVAEIADILGIPANTVKTYMDRGRKKLYEHLAQFWEKEYVKS